MINQQITFNDQFTLEDVDPVIEQLLKYHVIIDNEKLNKQYLILIEFVTNQTIFLLYYR